MKRASMLFAAALAAGFTTQAFAADAPLPAGVTRVTSVEGITEYHLANGLRVLLFPDNSKQATTVNITYLVGSRNEHYGETGMAHLLEHMVFKGATHHKNVPAELSAHGASPNGSTSYDRTNYFESFDASDANLDWALDLEADRMVNSFIADKDLRGADGKNGEMTVVRNEFERGENEPRRVLEERILSTSYLWHNYGKSTIGSRADVENVPIERLQAFYKNYYQPDDAVLTVAGRFDEAKTIALVNTKFGSIPKPTRELQKTYTAEPTQDGERTVTLRRVGDTKLIGVAYHIAAGSSPEFPAIDTLAYTLGSAPSGRLYKALVETKKAANVSCDAYQLREPGVLVCNAEVRKESDLADAEKILLSTIEDSAKNPPTQEEIERFRASELKNIDMVLQDSRRFGLSLSEWLATGDWRLFFLYRDHLKTMKPDEVAQVAEKYLKSSNRTVGEFIPTDKPDRSEIPPIPDVAAMVKDYKGGEALSSGEAFDPATANIDARTHRSTLPSGLKVGFLPKKTRGSTVFLNLTLRHGDEKNLQGKNFAAGMAGSMLMRGTTKHTRQQIIDESDRMKARVGVSGGAQGAYVSIETTRENLPGAFKLAVEILREPSFPETEFDTLKQAILASIENRKSEPGSRAQILYNRHVYPYPKDDPRYTATSEEQIEGYKNVTLEQAKAFYKGFYGASHGELSVVGDFDEKEMTALATELLGDWKSPAPYKRLESTYKDAAAMNETIETPDKTNAVWTAGQRIAMRDDDSDYAAMVLGNYMMGGGFLNSRLATRIRQKDGLSYGVGSQFGADAQDKDAYFATYASYAPQNLKKLENAFKEEIALALDKGFTADEIAAAKDGWLKSRSFGRSQDQNLTGSLGSHLYLDRTFKWDGDLEAKVNALTPAQVKSAMKRHIDWKKFSIVKAGDFAGAAKTAAAGTDVPKGGAAGGSGGGSK